MPHTAAFNTTPTNTTPANSQKPETTITDVPRYAKKKATRMKPDALTVKRNVIAGLQWKSFMGGRRSLQSGEVRFWERGCERLPDVAPI
jgi:hypothetical protein